MKVKIQKLQEKERIVTLDALYAAVASLDDRRAVKAFLRDLLTQNLSAQVI